jgi:DNA-binding protein
MQDYDPTTIIIGKKDEHFYAITMSQRYYKGHKELTLKTRGREGIAKLFGSIFTLETKYNLKVQFLDVKMHPKTIFSQKKQTQVQTPELEVKIKIGTPWEIQP